MPAFVTSLVLPLFFLLTSPALAADEHTHAPKPQAGAESKGTPAKSTSDTNMKVITGSGGKALSAIIADAPMSDDFVMGKKDAPVVIVEYASLSCPHCAHFSEAVLPELEKNYIETGKVRYVLRQFPLNEPALKGAMLLDCVGQQDSSKYYVFAKVLFNSQDKWAFEEDFLANLETIATVGGLSKDQFKNCVSSTDREMKVLKSKKLAQDELQIPHTPYIYVGGEVYNDNHTYKDLAAFIDAKLAQQKK